MRALLLIATVLALASVRPAFATAGAIPACTFEQGFKDLHDQIPDIVGDCEMNAQPQPSGDVQQRTKNGLLAWRKADNWTAFTNGAMTWINGPFGAQSRPNGDLLGWEALQGFPGTALYPPPWMDVFSGDPDVTYDASGYVLTYTAADGTDAYVQGSKGPFGFGQYESGIDVCLPGPNYCVFYDGGLPVSEDFLDQPVGGSQSVVSHRWGYGLNWFIIWYDSNADMTYSIFIAGDQAQRFGGAGDSQSNIAGARALADLAGGLTALPRSTAVDVVPAEEPITRQGKTGMNTAPFPLQGGDYIVDWKINTGDGRLCTISVRGLDDTVSESVVNDDFAGGPHGGQQYVYGLTPGRYYFDVYEGCGTWSLAIRHQ